MKKTYCLYLLLVILYSCLSEQDTIDNINTKYKTQRTATVYNILVEAMTSYINKGDYADIKLTLNNGIIIYFDPVTIDGKNDADIILITHTHHDHFSTKKIKEVKKDTTIILIPEGAYDAR